MSDLPISLVGIRSGEFITNRSGSKQNVGTVLQVRGFYPPNREEVEQMTSLFIRDTLNRIPFFAKMTPEQRSSWLATHSTAKKDLYMEDVPRITDVSGYPRLDDLAVKFIKIGGEFFVKRTAPGVIDELMRGNPADREGYWPLSEVLLKFKDVKGRAVESSAPAKRSGPRGGKHTLVFRPSNWVLLPTEVKTTSFSGMYFNMGDRTLAYGEVPSPKEGSRLFTFKTDKMKTLLPEYAVYVPSNRTSLLSWEHILKLCGEYSADMTRIYPLISWFPPSLHKSLIQKIIRTKCSKVEYAGEVYNSGSSLLASIAILMLHPGAFVPNIQRHVSGMESATKRLAVSICEDSYSEDFPVITSLYAAAAIAQQDKSWQPTDDILLSWFRLALLSQRDKRIFDYDWKESTSLTEWTPLSFNYFLLGELGSFESDIKMLASIAYRRGFPRTVVEESPLYELKTMPLIHCVDHHSFTEIAHYMPYMGKSFEQVFQEIWTKVVSCNPRLPRFATWNSSSKEAQDVRNAQRLLWISKIHKPVPRSTIPDKSYDFKYSLDPSWLCGLVGPLELKTPSAMVVMRTDNIFLLTAVKKPSRDSKVTELTDEEKDSAIKQGLAMLQSGLVLQHVPATLSYLRGCAARLRPETLHSPAEYIIRWPDGKEAPWSEVCHITKSFIVHPKEEINTESALLYTGDGVMDDADRTWKMLLESTHRPTLQRLSTYLEGSRSKISLYKIGRDGTGTDYTVVPEDTAVFSLLAQLCCLYPAALVKEEGGFSVKYGPLMWHLRDQIRGSIRSLSRPAPVWTLPTVDERKKWEHQRDIVESMQKRHLSGKRGHLLWVTVGLGKSMCTTDYIHWLIKQGDMPEYCVWSMPPSAMAAIKRQLDLAHLPYIELDMRSTSKGSIKTLRQGMVNLVVHDHMRLNGLDEQLKTHASKMLFIIDEFHRAMNKTIRTSLTLEIIKLCRDFVGLSGTIIKDTNLQDLIQWLEQVVDFEVTDSNYWVALSALISKKIQLPIEVERHTIEAKLLHPEAYQAMVPKTLGGTSARLHFREALQECYDSCREEMVRLALHHITAGVPVFMCASDSKQQVLIREQLTSRGVTKMHLLTKDAPLNLIPGDRNMYQCVITTKQIVEGYDMTYFKVLIQPVLLSKQDTRDQLEGRLIRLSQNSPMVRFITVHCGILSYIMTRYEQARTLSEALKGFAGDVDVEALDESH